MYLNIFIHLSYLGVKTIEYGNWRCKIYPWVDLLTYSTAQKKHYIYCFMKENGQIQMGIALFKNAVMPLKIWGINTTHQNFQMRYTNLF